MLADLLAARDLATPVAIGLVLSIGLFVGIILVVFVLLRRGIKDIAWVSFLLGMICLGSLALRIGYWAGWIAQ